MLINRKKWGPRRYLDYDNLYILHKKYYTWGSTRKEYEKYECDTSLGASSFILLYFISYLNILIYNTINYTRYQISKGFLDPSLSLITIFQLLMDHYFDLSFF